MAVRGLIAALHNPLRHLQRSSRVYRAMPPGTLRKSADTRFDKAYASANIEYPGRAQTCRGPTAVRTSAATASTAARHRPSGLGCRPSDMKGWQEGMFMGKNSRCKGNKEYVGHDASEQFAD